MDARKHARKIAARHMEQTGRCPYGVVTVEGGEFVEAHRPHRPADPRLGLRRDLGHPVGRVDRKTAPDHVRRIATTATAQLENPRPGGQPVEEAIEMTRKDRKSTRLNSSH